MDTQDTGTTEEQSSVQTDETSSADTSTENDDASQKRISDKELYLKDLDRQIKEKEALRKKSKSEETSDDVITWATMHSDDLKLVHEEYQDELEFYKSHKIPITNDIRDRALREARNKKGLTKTQNAEGARQKATSSEAGTEMRKGPPSPQLPDSVKQLSKTMTPEKYQKYREEFKARGLKV
jgi:hypothetical protein